MNIVITKGADVKKPMLTLWDYLTRTQQEQHEMICKHKEISENINNKDKKNNFEEANVIFTRKCKNRILENYIQRKRKSSIKN